MPTFKIASPPRPPGQRSTARLFRSATYYSLRHILESRPRSASDTHPALRLPNPRRWTIHSAVRLPSLSPPSKTSVLARRLPKAAGPGGIASAASSRLAGGWKRLPAGWSLRSAEAAHPMFRARGTVGTGLLGSRLAASNPRPYRAQLVCAPRASSRAGLPLSLQNTNHHPALSTAREVVRSASVARVGSHDQPNCSVTVPLDIQ